MKATFIVEVKNIIVTKPDKGFSKGGFSFNYKITTNGKEWKKWRTYDSSWSNQTAKHFEKVLKNGYAIKIALEQLL